MKLTLAILALAASIFAAPVPQGSYADYGKLWRPQSLTVTNLTEGDYSDAPVAPPAGGYGSYGEISAPPLRYANADDTIGDYGSVPVPPVENPPPPAAGYGNYGDYGAYKD